MQHIAIGKEVHTSLHMGHVISAGPCLYAAIQDVISIYHSFFFPFIPPHHLTVNSAKTLPLRKKSSSTRYLFKLENGSF